MHTHLRPIGMIVALATLACLVFSPATPAQAKGKKGKEHKVHGKITSVSTTSLTIAEHKKKGAKAGTAKDKTFEIGSHTRVYKESKKGKEPSSISALKTGQHVVIEAHGKHAHVIVIHHHHKKKKKA